MSLGITPPTSRFYDPANPSEVSVAQSDFKLLGLTHPDKQEISKDNNQIGDFMRLFIEQLKHQNPLEPQEGADFLAQIAQMQSVEELKNVETSVTKMSEAFQSSRILEATGMIGKSIEVPSDQMMLRTDGSGKTKTIRGEITLPDVDEKSAINNVMMNVINPSTGEIVKTYTYGPQSSGHNLPFSWDGTGESGTRVLAADGQPIPDGPYKIVAQAQVNGNWRGVGTKVTTSIDSVSVDSDTREVTLNASSIGQVKLSDLNKIYE